MTTASSLTEGAVLDALTEAVKPLKLRELSLALSLPVAERPSLKQLVREMAENRMIFIDEKRQIRLATQLPEVVMAQVTGFDDDGYGTLKILSEDVDQTFLETIEIWLFPERKRGRIPKEGAHILARVMQVGPSQYEAHTLRVLPERKAHIFGRVVKFRDYLGIESSEKGARQIIPLKKGGEIPQLDDLIEAELDDKAGRFAKIAHMTRNFGTMDKADAFIQMAITEFDIPQYFSDACLAQSEAAQPPVLEIRTDLRALPFVTIDGADAKDFDDAVFAEPTASGWRVIVAIADVSHYVPADSPLDQEAQKRGNSVYLPGTVIPMLPETLSNGLCSLVPHEDRATMAVEIMLNQQGQKQSHRFMRALIRSHARLTYDQVQTVFEGVAEEQDIDAPAGALHHLFGAWHGLNEARAKRGTLNLDIPEKRVSLNDAGQPCDITLRSQKEAHRLIEEFMILANICAAEEIEAKGQPCVYRTHDRPDMEKLDGIYELADALSIPFAKGQVITPHIFNKLLDGVKGKPEEQMVNDAVLRCQARAVYDNQNKGHYGLSLVKYAHFTSPIRRYADLLVHRALIEGCQLGPDIQIHKDHEALGAICSAISQTEQVAAKAERRTTDRLIACLYQEKVGQQVTATITGVANFGLFAQFDDRKAEGFLPMRSLPEDYYEVDDTAQRLVGRRYGITFPIGLQIQAQIESVEPASGGLLLTYLDGGTVDKAVVQRRKRKPQKNGKSHRKSRGAKKSRR